MAQRPACAHFVAEGRFVVAGLPIVAQVYAELDRDARVEQACGEGEWAAPGSVLAQVRAAAGTLLAGERVALNFLQRLSGVATLTRRAVEAVAGTAARITHTRKTTPGLRALERYAVTVGGGVENRGSLAEAGLWEENHRAPLGGGGRGVTVEGWGGIPPEPARAYAGAGARLISIGAVPHPAPAAPIRCDVALAPAPAI